MAPYYKSMNAAELMDSVFDVYKKSFIKQLAFSAFAGLAFTGLMLILAMAAAIVAAFSLTLYGIDEMGLIIGLLITVGAVAVPVYMIWTATASAGHIVLSRQAFSGLQVKLLINKLPRIILRVIGVILAQIIMALPFLAVCALCVYHLFVPDFTSVNFFEYLEYDYFEWIAYFSTTGWVLLAAVSTVVYIIYSNIYALSVPVAVFEKRSFFGAVARSWFLIKSEFWKILGLRMLWVAVIYVFTYAAQGLWTVVSYIFLFSPSLEYIGMVTSTVISLLISFLAGPLGGIFPAVMYFNQRIKKEGFDIELNIERLSI